MTAERRSHRSERSPATPSWISWPSRSAVTCAGATPGR
jgi:hypothetical protein